MPLTEAEERFMVFWEANRLNKRKVQRKYSIGLPLGLAIVAVFVNIFSGWDKRAEVVLRSYPSYIIVIVVAVIAIAIFISHFSAQYKWEQNEQRYMELKQKEAAHNAANV